METEFVSWPMVRYKREVLFGWVDLLGKNENLNHSRELKNLNSSLLRGDRRIIFRFQSPFWRWSYLLFYDASLLHGL